MEPTLPAHATRALFARLRDANRAFADRYAGESPERQPIHTVYGGAHQFGADVVAAHRAVALATLRDYFPDAATLASVLGLRVDPGLVYARVVDKLEREPVEDFRIDFEDGYGNRPDAEEDGHAIAAAEAVASAANANALPPFIGLRIKPFTEELRERSLRTLDLFVTTLVARLGHLPPGFVITMPKVQIAEQVSTLAALLSLLEEHLGLEARALRVELMVETTQAVIDADGRLPLPAMVRAADGRCTGVHFGTFDYTASCGITAPYQSMVHAACDFARDVMKVSLAGTPIHLSDGSTNILPVPRHHALSVNGNPPLTDAQHADNRAAVHAAARLHYDHVRHSLENGYYQGWDLHASQLPTRYAAVYAFFLEGLAAATTRLRSFVGKIATSTPSGDILDDAATGQALLNYFLRGLSSGAITEDEALATGLTRDELRRRSFVAILAARRNG